ncbi:MAG: FHA domain-containing protein [Chloroflexi bacterium]|nr:FHA domain-containing protein [Chloroflexota bacterium]
MNLTLDLMIMSGVDDGQVLNFATESGDGLMGDDNWTITLGRREGNDVCLRNDTYASRYHARLSWQDRRWWLEDCTSKNGTYIEGATEDVRVEGTIALEPGQLFRIGRTWLRIQAAGLAES